MSSWAGRLFGKWDSCPLLTVCVLVCAGLAVWGCVSQKGQGTGTTVPDVVAKKADNSECLICHMDFKAEVISARHEKAGVGCTDCHGSSLAHGDDELNITPPDRLFGRAEIDSFCKGCHSTHVAGRVYDDFVKKWHSKRRPNGRMILDDSVCTDCHGNHAILRVDQQSAKGGLDEGGKKNYNFF